MAGDFFRRDEVCGKSGANDPLGGICLAGAFVGGAMGKLSITGLDGEKDRLRNGLVEELQDIRVKFSSLELKMKNLDFRNLWSGWNANGFRGQLGKPKD